MKQMHIFACCLPLCLLAGGTQAEVTFHGFGQVVVGSTLDNNKPFPGYAYTADPDFQQESLFALQVQAPLTSSLSATAQVEAKGLLDYKPEFAWAYVSWKSDDGWLLKAGRQRIPFYLYSEYLDVGQAYPWIRPPVAVYTIPASNVNAVSLQRSWEVGSWIIQPQLLFGNSNDGPSAANMELQISGKNQVAAVMTATHDDWLTLRAAYVLTKLSVNSSQIDGVVNMLNAAGLPDAASEIDINNATTVYETVGFEINRSQWLLGGEYALNFVDHSFLSYSKSRYMVLGRHFGRWMPTITWERHDGAPTKSNALAYIPPGAVCTLDINGVPTPIPGGCTLVVSGMLESQNVQDHYYDFGLRYDISNNVAAKLDYTAYQSPVSGHTSANLISAAVAFTF